MKITLIAAVDDHNGIGKDNKIVWQNDEDMKHFRSYTEGKVVVMGRKTWDSLPVKPLPRRRNWVLCKNPLKDKRGNRFESVSQLLQLIKNAGLNSTLFVNEICIIGGQSIYEQFMPHATDLVITRIKGDYQCDKFFPTIDDSFVLMKTEQKQTCVIEHYQKRSKANEH